MQANPFHASSKHKSNLNFYHTYSPKKQDAFFENRALSSKCFLILIFFLLSCCKNILYTHYNVTSFDIRIVAYRVKYMCFEYNSQKKYIQNGIVQHKVFLCKSQITIIFFQHQVQYIYIQTQTYCSIFEHNNIQQFVTFIFLSIFFISF